MLNLGAARVCRRVHETAAGFQYTDLHNSLSPSPGVSLWPGLPISGVQARTLSLAYLLLLLLSF